VLFDELREAMMEQCLHHAVFTLETPSRITTLLVYCLSARQSLR
jgi:hypothetical protein